MGRMTTFLRGGIHPDDHKSATAGLPIEKLPMPKRVRLHLNQSIGEAANPIVNKGDSVKRGQIVAEAVGLGVPVHAPISGKVSSVAKAPHPSLVEGSVIVIDASELQEELEFPEDPQWQALPTSEMLARIRRAGIVGLGGAAFPTYRKLSLPPGLQIDTLIINGAECEPYLTCDHRVMLEQAEELVLGAWLLARIIGVNRCVIGLEDNKPDAAEALKRAIGKAALGTLPHPVEITVAIARTRYPQGSEKQLIQALTGRNVPARKLPMDIGVVVQNVATAIACHEAVRFRKPLLDRVITVSGAGIREPKNLRVPLGTNLDVITASCGGLKETAVKILAGGPMMGRTLPSLDVPLIKGNNGFLFLTREETYLGQFLPCINCGKCLDACPLGLEPNRISVFVEAGLPLQTADFGATECFECGCCAYVCPSKRPLVQFVQVAKSAYRRDQKVKEAARGN